MGWLPVGPAQFISLADPRSDSPRPLRSSFREGRQAERRLTSARPQQQSSSGGPRQPQPSRLRQTPGPTVTQYIHHQAECLISGRAPSNAQHGPRLNLGGAAEIGNLCSQTVLWLSPARYRSHLTNSMEGPAWKTPDPRLDGLTATWTLRVSPWRGATCALPSPARPVRLSRLPSHFQAFARDASATCLPRSSRVWEAKVPAGMCRVMIPSLPAGPGLRNLASTIRLRLPGSFALCVRSGNWIATMTMPLPP